MTLDQWTAIAEILGTIVIAATLAYLAIQTRQNASSIRASARHAMIQTDLQLVSDRLNNPSIAESFYKDELSKADMYQLNDWLIALVRSREHQWFMFRDGLLDEKMWHSYQKALSATLSFPRTRAWWEGRSHDFFDDEGSGPFCLDGGFDLPSSACHLPNFNPARRNPPLA